MIEFENLEQGSESWHKLRLGKFTASSALAIATVLKDGSAGGGLKTICYNIAAEKLSIKEYDFNDNFSNEHTERGHELEPLAINAYELKTKNKVHNMGFIQMNDYAGCSPDGTVDDDGLVEVKCRKDTVYLRSITERKIDNADMHQMQMQMLVSGRKWCDYIEFNPNFTKNIIITRIYPDPVIQEKILLGIERGKRLVEKILQEYKSLK